MSDMKIEIEHILLLVIGAFILYHFMSRGCGCNNGFRVGVPTRTPTRTRLRSGPGAAASAAECDIRIAEAAEKAAAEAAATVCIHPGLFCNGIKK